jgi:hypothetical protein
MKHRKLARRRSRKLKIQQHRARARIGRNPGSTLRALASAALALPGLTGTAQADSPPEEMSADYSYARYEEDELRRSKFAGGSRERYEIDIQQFHVEGPIGDRMDLGLDLVYEKMSGATPWFIVPNANLEPLQVMTGATIDDARTDLTLSGSYYYDRGKLSLGTGVSVEKDYRSLSGSVGGERHFNSKNTTLSGGVGLSFDDIEPTDPDADPFRPDSENKKTYSAHVGLSQILDWNSLIQTNLAYKRSSGYLSDPYKQVLVAGLGIVGDRRPDKRNQIAWLTQYRRHFPVLRGTLHAEYQLGWDNWDVTSHMLDLAWYQDLFDVVKLIPSVRYYSQSEADFYDNFFLSVPSDNYYSCDYRVSGFGALAFRLKLEGSFKVGPTRWNLAIAAERYASDGDLALRSVTSENPGLVSFNLYSVRLSTSF